MRDHVPVCAIQGSSSRSREAVCVLVAVGGGGPFDVPEINEGKGRLPRCRKTTGKKKVEPFSFDGVVCEGPERNIAKKDPRHSQGSGSPQAHPARIDGVLFMSDSRICPRDPGCDPTAQHRHLASPFFSSDPDHTPTCSAVPIASFVTGPPFAVDSVPFLPGGTGEPYVTTRIRSHARDGSTR